MRPGGSGEDTKLTGSPVTSSCCALLPMPVALHAVVGLHGPQQAKQVELDCETKKTYRLRCSAQLQEAHTAISYLGFCVPGPVQCPAPGCQQKGGGVQCVYTYTLSSSDSILITVYCLHKAVCESGSPVV